MNLRAAWNRKVPEPQVYDRVLVSVGGWVLLVGLPLVPFLLRLA